MTTVPSLSEDPLVAALPPKTDYITYLTLLEYQLKPNNLSTLNRLLLEDDGTLAAEVGWDLLRLVLPMLQVVPEEANRCLSIIARRGNPREVVVRVAEELERLGNNEEDDPQEEDGDEDVDDLPTFAGEAKRVHLGDLTLDGMSPGKSSKTYSATEDLNEAGDVHAETGSDDGLLLTALVSMLGTLHPRIKTQYPSRFLATSLPAALKAYRHLQITEYTTAAFIDFLHKLSGRQRPALPPRTSTASGIPTLPSAQAPGANTTASLPDPEAKSEAAANVANSTTSEKESSIVQKLLQAVALEVLDEYVNSFRSSELPHMSWTARVREVQEPQRVIPGKLTEQQRWQNLSELMNRDETITKFIKLCNALSLNITEAFKTSNESITTDDNHRHVDTDYPTSPADIPFPHSGLTLLYAAQQFYHSDAANNIAQSAPHLAKVLESLQTMEIATEQHLTVTDAHLSLIYTALSASSSPTSEALPQSLISTSLETLSSLFITNPDPSIRDNAHHVASTLLHTHADQVTTTAYIQNLLSPSPPQTSPIIQIQSGNTKAIAINFLKDAILSRNLQPSILTTDPYLQSYIFPLLPSMPGPFTTSHPATTSTSMSTEQDLEDFLLHIPAYISALNLLCILTNLQDHPPQNPSSSTQLQMQEQEQPIDYPILSGPLLQHTKQFLSTLEEWKDNLLVLMTAVHSRGAGDGSASSTSAAANNDSPIDISDLYALEDACLRARSLIDS